MRKFLSVMPPRSRLAMVGAALAAVMVWLRLVVLPRRPADADTPRPRRVPQGDAVPRPDGDGLRIVVNPSSGPALKASPLEELREGLPAADIHELTEDDDLLALLRDPDFAAVGAAGGDGTLAAAASVALERDALLVAVPAGTLNHLARDLGLSSAEDAIAAVRAGFAARIDVGCVADRIFVNTFSFGGYSCVVDHRERLESRVGKWPALLIALVRELPRMKPLRLTIDGRPHRVWLAYVGNCTYSPAGFAPAWRESLDDGLLDVRIVQGARRFSKTRFACAALFGRLSTCAVYSEWRATSVDVVSADGPLRLAADGETFDGPAEFTISKRPSALLVALPPPDPEPDR
ncbi:MAG: diacylglycerol kinase family protein [Acidimicrobiales bacterium]|nr:diacylglycerol kinase family protein [Acidimicrobiales bacterium]